MSVVKVAVALTSPVNRNLRIFFRYNEVCKPGYKFSGGSRNSGTGHFTQVVWKESTVLGIGRAEAEEGGMKCAYIVGRYKPAGNFIGEYQQNVPKGSFDAASYCASIGSDELFDQQEVQEVGNHWQSLAITAKSRVDAPVEKTGPAEFRGATNLN